MAIVRRTLEIAQSFVVRGGRRIILEIVVRRVVIVIGRIIIRGWVIVVQGALRGWVFGAWGSAGRVIGRHGKCTIWFWDSVWSKLNKTKRFLKVELSCDATRRDTIRATSREHEWWPESGLWYLLVGANKNSGIGSSTLSYNRRSASPSGSLGVGEHKCPRKASVPA